MNLKKRPSPSMDQWLREAKRDSSATQVGMFLTHNGVVRETPKSQVRQGINDGTSVKGMIFSYDAKKVEKAIAEAKELEGIFYLRVWLNEGELEVGDDIMYILIGGDIRPNVIHGLQFLVEKIKTQCVTEIETT